VSAASPARLREETLPLSFALFLIAQVALLLLVLLAPPAFWVAAAAAAGVLLLLAAPIPVLAGILVLGGALFPFTGYRFRVALGGLSGLLFLLLLADRLRLFARGRLFAERAPLDRPVFALLALVALASLIGITGGATIEQWPLEAFPYLCLAMVPVLARNLGSQSTARIFAVYAAFLFAQSIYAVILFAREGFVRMHTPSFSVHPGLAAVVLLAVAALHEERKWRAWATVALFPMILQLVATLTRGYWTGFLSGAVVVGFFALRTLPRERFRRLARRSLLGTLAVLACVAAGLARWGLLESIEVIWDRLGTFASLGIDASTRVRVIEWGLALRHFAERPILGTGYGFTLEFFHPLYRLREPHWWFVHNSYLLLLLKMGIVGLAAFGWLLASYFRTALAAIRAASGTDKVLLVGFYANIVQLMQMALTNYTFCSPVNLPYMAFLLGATAALAREREARNGRRPGRLGEP